MKPAIMEESLRDLIIMVRRQTYLRAHMEDGYKISETKDGRWCSRVPDISGKRKSIPIIKKSRVEIENAIVEVYSKQYNNPTIHDIFFTLYLKTRHDMGRIGVETFRASSYDYKRYFDIFGESRIKDLIPNDFVIFVEETFYKSHLDGKSYAKFKGVLKAILNTAVKHDLIDYTYEFVMAKVDVSKNDIMRNRRPPKTEIYSRDEQERIIEFCKTSNLPHDKGILLFFATGLRNGEMAALKWEDYDGRFLHIHREERTEIWEHKKRVFVEDDTGKTPNAIRVIPLPPVAIRTLDELKESSSGSGYIFIGNRGNRISCESFRKRLRKLCDILQIPYRSPHKIRKTNISEKLNAGVPLTVVSRNAGHADSNVTISRYAFNTLTLEEMSHYYDQMPALK